MTGQDLPGRRLYGEWAEHGLADDDWPGSDWPADDWPDDDTWPVPDPVPPMRPGPRSATRRRLLRMAIIAVVAGAAGQEWPPRARIRCLAPRPPRCQAEASMQASLPAAAPAAFAPSHRVRP